MFIQKYREDQVFAKKVDESVLRILTLKYEIYPDFEIEEVIPDENNLANIGLDNDITSRIASSSVTLISPELDQLGSTLPNVPEPGERIVIFTDVIEAGQCSDCLPQSIVAVDSLEKAILKLYGPGGSGQISAGQFTSYSFTDLQDYVDNPFNRVELETNLSRADWVLFVVQDNDSDRAGSNALKNLLAQKISAIRNKNVIVFSFNAPYYFDATDISAFTAYYGLYSKLPDFIDVAARILFQEINPAEVHRFSIPGVAYDLITATTPDPNQIIELLVDDSGTQTVGPENNNGAAEESGIVYNLGDNLPVRTGVILITTAVRYPMGQLSNSA